MRLILENFKTTNCRKTWRSGKIGKTKVADDKWATLHLPRVKSGNLGKFLEK